MSITKTNKTKNGQQQYRVRVYINGKQTERKVYGLSNAKLVEIELSNTTAISSLTVGQLCDEYIEVKKTESRASTLNNIERYVRMYIKPTLGKIKLTKLTTKQLQDWKLVINECDLQIITKKGIFKNFSAILNYAVKLEYIATNNLKKLGNFKDTDLKMATNKLQYYTAEEFRLYIDTLKSNCETIRNWNYYTLLNIAFYTGARKGEIRALLWNDIKDNYVTIDKSYDARNDIVTAPKNKSSVRKIQLPVPLINVLNEHRQRLIDNDMYSDDGLICGYIVDSVLSRLNVRTANSCNLHVIRIHDFRHTHASVLINADINIMEISRRLGHSQVDITWNIYGHLYPQAEEVAIDVLNKI